MQSEHLALFFMCSKLLHGLFLHVGACMRMLLSAPAGQHFVDQQQPIPIDMLVS